MAERYSKKPPVPGRHKSVVRDLQRTSRRIDAEDTKPRCRNLAVR
jgi:hypothetical protein